MTDAHEALVQKVADYLTKQFIWDNITQVPKDECISEARHIIGLIAEETKETTAEMQRVSGIGVTDWPVVHRASALWPKEKPND